MKECFGDFVFFLIFLEDIFILGLKVEGFRVDEHDKKPEKKEAERGWDGMG